MSYDLEAVYYLHQANKSLCRLTHPAECDVTFHLCTHVMNTVPACGEPCLIWDPDGLVDYGNEDVLCHNCLPL